MAFSISTSRSVSWAVGVMWYQKMILFWLINIRFKQELQHIAWIDTNTITQHPFLILMNSWEKWGIILSIPWWGQILHTVQKDQLGVAIPCKLTSVLQKQGTSQESTFCWSFPRRSRMAFFFLLRWPAMAFFKSGALSKQIRHREFRIGWVMLGFGFPFWI
jgi:hypothetical protein